MLIRDVGNNEFKGAYNELSTNISQIINNTSKYGDNFLTALFCGKLKSQCLNFYEKSIFNTEINKFEKLFVIKVFQKDGILALI